MKYFKLPLSFILLITINYQLFSQKRLGGNLEFIDNIVINTNNLSYYNTINYKSKIKHLAVNVLSIDGINGKRINSENFKIRVEKSILIKNCFWTDVKRILNVVDSNSYLEDIVFENIKFDEAKEIIIRFRKIKSLVFVKCDSISQLNFNIRKRVNRKLNKFDFSNCNLTSIPDFSNLLADTVLLTNNTKLNIINERSKLPVSIKYLAIDKTPSTKNYDFQKMFNGTVVYLDSTAYKLETVIENKKKHGVFKITKQEQILYSGAYTQLSRILQRNPYVINIDTVLYDQRFDDLSYKKLTKNNNSVQLYNIKILSKRYNKRICFELVDFKGNKDMQMVILREFPEYYLFRKINWVYDKPVKKSEFVRLYRKRKWHDYKLLYDDKVNTFTFVFKNDTSFFSIEAKPLFKKGQDDPNKLLENYRKLYLSYLKKTEARKHKFNKKIANEYLAYKKASERYNDSCWVVFSKLYLSEDERNMTKEEWLKYYVNILSDEKNILNHSFVMQTTLNRALDLIGFSSDVKNFTTQTNTVNFRLIDKDNKILAVDNASIIDLQNLNYMNFKGGCGYNQAKLFINPLGRYVIYAELLNGDIAIVKPEDFIYNPNDNFHDLLFKASVIKKELSSLEQVLSYFGLKL